MLDFGIDITISLDGREVLTKIPAGITPDFLAPGWDVVHQPICSYVHPKTEPLGPG